MNNCFYLFPQIISSINSWAIVSWHHCADFHISWLLWNFSQILLQQTAALANSPHAERYLGAINPPMNSDRGYFNNDEWLQLITNDKARTCRGQNKPNVFHVRRVQTGIRLKRPLNLQTTFFLKVKGIQYVYTHTHTHSYVLSVQTKHLFREKTIRALHYNNGYTVTKKRYYIQCQSEFWDGYELSPVWFQKDRLHGTDTATTVQQQKKHTESYYYDSALPLSGLPSLFPSPITSSNYSNLSCCTVTTWFISKWQTDVGEIGCCQRDTELHEGFVCHTISTGSKSFPSLLSFN